MQIPEEYKDLYNEVYEKCKKEYLAAHRTCGEALSKGFCIWFAKLEAEKAVKDQMKKDAKAKRKSKREQWAKDHPRTTSFYNGAKQTLKNPALVISLITIGIVAGAFGYAASKSE